MAFNAGREFNKFASTQGAGFFGALPQANQKQELRFAGTALNNVTRMKSALEGIALAEREGSKNRSNSLTNTLIGAGSNILGSGLTAGIKQMQAPQVPDYSAESTPVTMNQLTAPESWTQNNEAIQGLMTDGFSWQQDPFQGQNPYSINIKGW